MLANSVLWLILCVALIRLRMAKYLVKHYSGNVYESACGGDKHVNQKGTTSSAFLIPQLADSSCRS